MKKILLLLLFSFALFGQTIKVTALPEAKKIDRTDLLLLTQPATGTPVSKKMSFQTLLDSAKVIIADYTATIPPLSTSMLNSTEALELPLFHDARVAWQDSINSAFEKIDGKTIFFDENDFTLDDDNVLQLNDILAIDTLMRVNTLLSKDDTSLVTGKGIADYVKRVRDSLNTVGNLTNVAYKGQSNDFGAFTQTSGTLNATSALQLNGTSINTTGTLSKVGYLDGTQTWTGANTFTQNLVIPNSIRMTNTAADGLFVIGASADAGVDTTRIIFSSGGSGSTTRGAFFVACGNEYPAAKTATGFVGSMWLYTGNVTGSHFAFRPKGSLANQMMLDEVGNLAIKGATATSALDINGDAEVGSANYFYFGDPTTDGSWRIGRSGNNLVFERRESGSWVTKQTMIP